MLRLLAACTRGTNCSSDTLTWFSFCYHYPLMIMEYQMMIFTGMVVMRRINMWLLHMYCIGACPRRRWKWEVEEGGWSVGSPDHCTCTAQVAPECLTLRPVQISQGAEGEGGCIGISNFPLFRDLAGYYPVNSGVIESHLVGGDRGKERAEVWRASGQHLWIYNST